MNAPTDDRRWLDEPKNVQKVVWATVAICVASCIPDLGMYHKHGHFSFEEIPAFHAAYGFVSCVLLVIAATQMRRLVMRAEDYYEPSDEPEGRILEDHERG
jgi:hypothetical protein